MQHKVSSQEYSELLDKKMEEMKDMPAHEQLIEMVNWCSQFKIINAKYKKYAKNKRRKKQTT